jgi:hypothetical protein
MHTKKTPRKHCWRIMRLKHTMPAEFVGHVSASDEQSALAKAVEKFQVSPECRNRLLALCIDSSTVGNQTVRSEFISQAELASV